MRNATRKTRDEFQIHGLYSCGWEEVTAEDTRKEARARLKEYRENDTATPYKLVRKRIPLAGAAADDGYAEYCEAKRDIGEEPLTREQFLELNAKGAA